MCGIIYIKPPINIHERRRYISPHRALFLLSVLLGDCDHARDPGLFLCLVPCLVPCLALALDYLPCRTFFCVRDPLSEPIR